MRKILIIDDDPRNIFALSATLKQRGFVCLDAIQADIGMHILENEENISAVMLDMMMPEMDGYELINIIRNHDKLKEIPIIAVTAQAMPGDREKCLESGANEYIPKPINVDRMFTILDQYIK
jgi:two-component system, cell cycle response regulator DivK